MRYNDKRNERKARELAISKTYEALGYAGKHVSVPTLLPKWIRDAAVAAWQRGFDRLNHEKTTCREAAL